jgi:hypothetical protein
MTNGICIFCLSKENRTFKLSTTLTWSIFLFTVITDQRRPFLWCTSCDVALAFTAAPDLRFPIFIAWDPTALGLEWRNILKIWTERLRSARRPLEK